MENVGIGLEMFFIAKILVLCQFNVRIEYKYGLSRQNFVKNSLMKQISLYFNMKGKKCCSFLKLLNIKNPNK